MLEDDPDFGARMYWNGREWTRRLSELSPQAVAAGQSPWLLRKAGTQALAAAGVGWQGGSSWKTARFWAHVHEWPPLTEMSTGGLLLLFTRFTYKQ